MLYHYFLVAHKLVTSRGTTVFLDLMEQQLSKEEISNLMSVQDNDGNTPVHLFSDASVATIDRLLPYVKHCWTIRNDKYDEKHLFGSKTKYFYTGMKIRCNATLNDAKKCRSISKSPS
jgi:hypothetical protein